MSQGVAKNWEGRNLCPWMTTWNRAAHELKCSPQTFMPEWNTPPSFPTCWIIVKSLPVVLKPYCLARPSNAQFRLLHMLLLDLCFFLIDSHALIIFTSLCSFVFFHHFWKYKVLFEHQDTTDRNFQTKVTIHCMKILIRNFWELVLQHLDSFDYFENVKGFREQMRGKTLARKISLGK